MTLRYALNEISGVNGQETPCKIGDGIWRENMYSSLVQVRQYAKEWLNLYAPRNIRKLVVDNPYDYNGLGDKVVIRRVTK